MRTKKLLLKLVCFTGCLCLSNAALYAGQKTPGQKLDNAIDTVKDKTHDAKVAAKDEAEKAKEKAREAKETADRKCNEARRDLADKIRP